MGTRLVVETLDTVERAAEPADAEAKATVRGALDFPAVFAAHFDYVWYTLRRLGVRDAELEDVTHDVFLAVFRKRADYDPARPLRPWLFGFAFRHASDHRELARHRFDHSASAAEHQDPSPGALEHAIRSQALRTAQIALASLELDRRAVFILHELDDCPIPEVALVLEIPLNTAYSRLRLARADLAAQVRRLRLRGEP